MATNVHPLASADVREVRSTSPHRSPTERPWYRAEPWVVPSLAAFVPLIVGHWLPAAAIRPMLAIGYGLMLLGIGMLVRQGFFRSAGDPPRRPAR